MPLENYENVSNIACQMGPYFFNIKIVIFAIYSKPRMCSINLSNEMCRIHATNAAKKKYFIHSLFESCRATDWIWIQEKRMRPIVYI